MRVLVTEATAGESVLIQRDLAAAGFRVSSCHSGVGICQAVTQGRCCPLDDSVDPVCVMVDVRSSPTGRLTAREYGVVCALRVGVPLVVTSLHLRPRPTPPEGLEPLAVTARRWELVGVCRRAAGGRRSPSRPIIPWPTENGSVGGGQGASPPVRHHASCAEPSPSDMDENQAPT